MPTSELTAAVASAYRAIVDSFGADDPAEGVKLPPERDLAVELGVSRSTLRAALASLESEGRITRLRGRNGGTYLDGTPEVPGPRKMERRPGVAISVPKLLAQQGFVVGTRILATALLPMPPEATEVLPEFTGAPAAMVERIRLADGVSLSWEKAYFPANRLPGLLEQPLSGSLYDLLEREYGIHPETVSERIEVIAAEHEASRVLGIDVDAPLISVTRWTRDSEGEAIEYSYDLFRADRTRLMVESSRAHTGRRAGLRILAP